MTPAEGPVPGDPVEPDIQVKPPFDQPGLEAVLKSKVVVGCDGNDWFGDITLGGDGGGGKGGGEGGGSKPAHKAQVARQPTRSLL